MGATRRIDATASALNRFLRSTTLKLEPQTFHPPFVALLDELILWLSHTGLFTAHHLHPWSSLRRDLNQAVQVDLGKRLKKKLTSLDLLIVELKSLEPTAATGSTSRGKVMTYGHLADWPGAAHARSLAEDIREELAEPSAAAAAFADVADAFTRPSVRAESLVGLRTTLWDTLKATGRSDESARRLFQQFLVDFTRGDVLAEPDLDIPAELIAAVASIGIDNLPDNLRMRLIETALSRPVRSVSHTVWTAYRAASLGGHEVIRLGRVTFFDGTKLAERVRSEGALIPAAGDPILDELRLNDSPEDLWFREPADVEHWVVVRVELEAGAYSDPLAQARAAADFVIAEARADAIFSTPSTWIPLEGFKTCTGSRTLSSRFRVAVERPLLYADTVGDTLESMGRYPPDRQPPSWLVDIHRGFARTDEQLGADSLVADVRAIEAIAHRFGMPGWQGVLEEYLAPAWCSGRVRALLFTGVSTFLTEAIDVDTANFAKQRTELRLQIFSPAGRHENFSFVAAIEAVPTILSTFPESSFSRRILSDLWESLETPSGRTQTRRILMERHQHNVTRAARCRNGLIHGTPTNPSVVLQAARFIHQAAASVIAIARRADSNGLTGVEQLRQTRLDMVAVLDAFERASDPAAALTAFLR